jgi:hypothetical protein
VAVIKPDDIRYPDLVTRGYNKRFAAQPDSVRLVHSAAQIGAILEEAVRTGARVSVRSGGHCFENLVDNADTRILIDMCEMNDAYYDSSRGAFAVQAGAVLGDVYSTLFLNWGITLPAGVCPNVGVGGHVAGGGYGPLSRRYGLVVDHLYAVEVVVVTASGSAKTVVATREANDPNRELWWAHTGGGGGNFGVVTRYWFRTPGVTGADPAKLLPPAPAAILTKFVTWPWNNLTETDFTRLVKNHGAWNAANAGPSAPPLHSGLHLNQKSTVPEWQTTIDLDTQIDATLPRAEQILDQYIAAVTEGVSVVPTIKRTVVPWLKHALSYGTDVGDFGRIKSKGAYMRQPWTDEQVATAYRHLTGPLEGGLFSVLLYSYGSRINTVGPSATAVPQRDSIMKAWYSVFWADPALDAGNIAQVRNAYRDIHSATGGMPAPGAGTDGLYINYPDIDVLDPQWNASGVHWSRLFYKDNYPRLQQVKAKYDPRNFFRHVLSVQPPATAAKK